MNLKKEKDKGPRESSWPGIHLEFPKSSCRIIMNGFLA
jgi:hypothetical protein